MFTVLLVAACLCALLIIGAVAEQLRFNERRQNASSVTDTAGVTLVPTPIDPAWMIEGEPITEAAEIARTDDGTTCVYLWQTTRATYRWVHESDEIVTVIAGDVFVADESGPERSERHLGVGDVAFFPAGTRTLWRVPDQLRKISTLTRPLPYPVASVMRWLRAIKRWLKTSRLETFASHPRRERAFDVQR